MLPEASAAMLSMGGKSMQLGREDALHSLPFAMHLGFGILTGHRDRALSWPERLALVSATYERLTAEAKLRQNIPTIEGLVVGVTDTVQATVVESHGTRGTSVRSSGFQMSLLALLVFAALIALGRTSLLFFVSVCVCALGRGCRAARCAQQGHGRRAVSAGPGQSCSTVCCPRQ